MPTKYIWHKTRASAFAVSVNGIGTLAKVSVVETHEAKTIHIILRILIAVQSGAERSSE